jgi:hypothetical protein
MSQRYLLLLPTALFVAFIITPPADAFSAEKVANIPWGASDSQLGLLDKPEMEHVGPTSFCLDDEGRIIVCDPVNRSVKQFDSDGNFLTVLASKVVANHVAAATGDKVFVRADGGRVLAFSGGKQTAAFAVPSSHNLIEGYEQGLGIISEGTGAKWLAVSNPSQKPVLVAQIEGQNAGAKALAPDKIRTLSGKPEVGGVQYRPQWKSKHLGHLRRFNSDGSELTPIVVYTNDRLGAIIFKGIDRQGRMYVEMERITPDGYAHLEVRCYTDDGKLVDSVELPNLYYTTVYRKTWLTPDGAIIHMLTTPEKVTFTRWSRKGE